MTQKRPHSGWLVILGIAVALVVWGSLLALGAYLHGGDPADPVRDPRKAWIVLVSTAGFLAFWGVALLVRARRR